MPKAKPAQVAAHAPGADFRFGEAESLRKPWLQLAMTEALGLETEQDQHRQQRLHPLLPKGQGGDMLAVDLGRLLGGSIAVAQVSKQSRIGRGNGGAA